jgi:hypothetical protein
MIPRWIAGQSLVRVIKPSEHAEPDLLNFQLPIPHPGKLWSHPRMGIIPETVTPKELADATGWGERFVRETARALGACLGSGRGMRLTHDDVLKIMEAKRPKLLGPRPQTYLRSLRSKSAR